MRTFTDEDHDRWIDQALEALGSSETDFFLHLIPVAPPFRSGADDTKTIALCCGQCDPDDHSRFVDCPEHRGRVLFTVSEMELWEFVHDARQHYEEFHVTDATP